MAKDKLTDYSATNASNTDVGGVNINEGMLPSDVNNAIREVMTHLKDFAEGTEAVNSLAVDNININGNTISSTDTNGNINITPNGSGAVAFTTNATFGDNDKAIFGAGSDLQIYHTSSTSYIYEQGTGDLRIRGSQVRIEDDDGSTLALFKEDAGVELRHNGSVKLESVSTGVDVTGGFTATAASTITTADNTVQLTLKSTDADANVGPILDMIRDSGSPADGDELGRIRFKGDDDAGNDTTYAYLQVKINDAGDGSGGSEDGELEIFTRQNANGRSRMKFGFDSAQAETVFNEGSQDIDFRVEGDTTAKLLFVDAGNERVEINSASPELHLIDTTNNTDAIIRSNNNGDIVFEADENAERDNTIIRFDVDGSEKMRLDSGNLLVGGTSLGENGAVTMGGDGRIYAIRASDTAGFFGRTGADGSIVNFTKDGGTVGVIGTIGGDMVAGTGDTGLRFHDGADQVYPSNTNGSGRDNAIDLGNSGARFKHGYFANTVYTASVAGISDNDTYINFANNNIMQFITGGSERMRILSGGQICAGTTSANGSEILQLSAGGVQWSTGPNTTNGSFDVFNASGTGVYLSSGSTAWSGISDERYKDIIEPIINASEKVSALRPIIGKYKTDEADVRRSFLIAQDVQAVFPEAVDAQDESKLGLRYADLIPLLTGALQEAIAKIETLEARIATLEAN